MREMLQTEVSDDLKELKKRVEGLVNIYEEAINSVKDKNDQELQDMLARRLYDMTAEILMSLLILDDATRAPELFAKSANVYVRMAEENVVAKNVYVHHFNADDLKHFRACNCSCEE